MLQNFWSNFTVWETSAGDPLREDAFIRAARVNKVLNSVYHFR